jgi:predicted RecA/RadA family phage recombinase
MAYATFSGEGRAIDYTPTTDVATGDVVVQGDLVGVARAPIPANTTGALVIASVFDFAKATGAGSGIGLLGCHEQGGHGHRWHEQVPR